MDEETLRIVHEALKLIYDARYYVGGHKTPKGSQFTRAAKELEKLVEAEEFKEKQNE